MAGKNEKILQLDEKLALRIYNPGRNRVRLFCFPFIGANSIHFRDLARQLPRDWQVMAIDPPGHGRSRGELLTDFKTLIKLYLEHLKPVLRGRFYILGHSLGGLIGYSLALCLQAEGVKPGAVFISAVLPPHRVRDTLSAKSTKADREYIKEELGKLGGKYSLLAENSGFLFAYMPLLNADYKLMESFRDGRRGQLACPVHILYSREDEIVQHSAMREWEGYGKTVDFHVIPGGHNYVLTGPQAVAQKLINVIDNSIV